MKQWVMSENVQLILGLLGRGVVQAFVGLGAMLIAHVTDREKATGVLLLLFLAPLASYLHITLPNIPLPMLRRMLARREQATQHKTTFDSDVMPDQQGYTQSQTIPIVRR